MLLASIGTTPRGTRDGVAVSRALCPGLDPAWLPAAARPFVPQRVDASTDTVSKRLVAPGDASRSTLLIVCKRELRRLGDAIARARGKVEPDLAAFAAQAGLSPGRLEAIERAASEPELGELVAIAQALGVHVADLVDGID
jgi:hypothetical protein